MSYISKVELKYQLEKMGVKVEGNYIRKSDLKKVIATTNRYWHGSPKDHGDILEVLPYSEVSYGHDFGGVFLSQESKWGHIGPSKNFWYYIDLKDSEILQLRELYYHHNPKELKIRKVLELFELLDTPYATEKRHHRDYEEEDERSDLDFIWDVICGKGNMRGNNFVRLSNIAVLGEQAEWQIQTIQGQIAKELGFKAIEMEDERGTAYLLVGPNEMQKEDDDEQELD